MQPLHTRRQHIPAPKKSPPLRQSSRLLFFALLLLLLPVRTVHAQQTLVDSFVVDGIKHVRRYVAVALAPEQDSSGLIEQAREFILEKHYDPSGKIIFSANIDVVRRAGVITRCEAQQQEWNRDGSFSILTIPAEGAATQAHYNKLGKLVEQKTLKRQRALSQLNF